MSCLETFMYFWMYSLSKSSRTWAACYLPVTLEITLPCWANEVGQRRTAKKECKFHHHHMRIFTITSQDDITHFRKCKSVAQSASSRVIKRQ